MNRIDSFADGKDIEQDGSFNVIVRSSDMNDAEQREAADVITEALSIHPKETQVAQMIKSHFDKKHGRAWQCIVGKHFASYVTHEVNTYLLVAVGQVNVMLYKTSG